MKIKKKVLNKNYYEIENQKLRQQIYQLTKDIDLIKEKYEIKFKNVEIEIIIQLSKKLIPIIEELRLAIENSKDNPWINGYKIIYEKFLKFLESYNIYQIDSIGKEPNELYHIPIGFEEHELKGKIIKEYQKCYIYKGDKEIVISEAKVILGS